MVQEGERCQRFGLLGIFAKLCLNGNLLLYFSEIFRFFSSKISYLLTTFVKRKTHVTSGDPCAPHTYVMKKDDVLKSNKGINIHF